MNKEDFVATFLEGATYSNPSDILECLVGMVYDLRRDVRSKKEHIEYMDEIARDNTISMHCRSCRDSWEPDCELSEISHEGNYCGKNQWCCP